MLGINLVLDSPLVSTPAISWLPAISHPIFGATAFQAVFLMRSSTMLNDLDPDLIRGLPVHICLGHGVAHWARQVIPMPTKEKLGRLRDLFREWGFEFLGFFFFLGGGA